MKVDIARAWKDAEYRASLSTEELATLPENPVGVLELNEAEMLEAAGGLPFTQGVNCITLNPGCIPPPGNPTQNYCWYTGHNHSACTYGGGKLACQE